jgi:hypothetical protein
LPLWLLLWFSPFDGCERVNRLRMLIRQGNQGKHSAHLLLIHRSHLSKEEYRAINCSENGRLSKIDLRLKSTRTSPFWKRKFLGGKRSRDRYLHKHEKCFLFLKIWILWQI